MCYDCISGEESEELRKALEELNHEPAQKGEGIELTYACKLSEVPPNGSRGKVVAYENTEVAIFSIREQLYVISNICPHEQSPLLSEGRIDKEKLLVTCPLHGWTFSLMDGKMEGGGGSISIYQPHVIDGDIWIDI